MLVMTHGGRERTEPELRQILQQGGFELKSAIPTHSQACIIEAVRI